MAEGGRAGRKEATTLGLAAALRLTGRLMGRMALAFLVLSFFWAAFHAIAPVRETPLMGLRRLGGEEITAQWMPLGDISPHLVRAVIAAEDNTFCRHHGFDLGEIKAAIEEARAGEGLRGASTISQQTAKNVFLWPGGGLFRKGLEAWFTLLTEMLWSKEAIMETYLNVAEWGDGVFGAEAAAQARFGKPAAALTPAEASLLAAVLPNPHEWRVDPPGPYVAARSRRLRSRMADVRREGRADCILPGG